MIEVLLCSVVTILPDFLYRRFVQGKRLGREITLYSIWYELRYGITACLGLTIVLLTLILYYHPSTSSAVSTASATVPPFRCVTAATSREYPEPVSSTRGSHPGVQDADRYPHP